MNTKMGRGRANGGHHHPIVMMTGWDPIHPNLVPALSAPLYCSYSSLLKATTLSPTRHMGKDHEQPIHMPIKRYLVPLGVKTVQIKTIAIVLKTANIQH